MRRCEKGQMVTQMAERELLKVGARVLALAERLKKKDTPKHL